MTWLTESVVRQEPERINARRTLWFTLGVIAALVGSVILIWFTLPQRLRTLRTDRLPVEPVSRVEQARFIPVARGIRMRERALEGLEETSWVDREAGIARIPVDQAVDLYLQRPELREGRGEESP